MKGARAQARRAADRKGWTPSGLPAWLGYFGRKRPDGILIQYLNWKDRHTGPRSKRSIVIHLIEFTFTSERSMLRAERAKIKQYQEVMESIKKNGWRVELHTLIMGVRGWMPEHTWEGLGRLGVPKSRRQALYEKLSRLANTALISSINTRRKLEVRGDREKSNKTDSGFVRFINNRKEQRNAERKMAKQTKQTAGYKNRLRPKKGEG